MHLRKGHSDDRLAMSVEEKKLFELSTPKEMVETILINPLFADRITVAAVLSARYKRLAGVVVPHYEVFDSDEDGDIKREPIDYQQRAIAERGRVHQRITFQSSGECHCLLVYTNRVCGNDV